MSLVYNHSWLLWLYGSYWLLWLYGSYWLLCCCCCRLCGRCHGGSSCLVVYSRWRRTPDHTVPAGESDLCLVSCWSTVPFCCIIPDLVWSPLLPTLLSPRATSSSAQQTTLTSRAWTAMCLSLLTPWPWPCPCWSPSRCATPLTGVWVGVCGWVGGWVGVAIIQLSRQQAQEFVRKGETVACRLAGNKQDATLGRTS